MCGFLLWFCSFWWEWVRGEGVTRVMIYTSVKEFGGLSLPLSLSCRVLVQAAFFMRIYMCSCCTIGICGAGIGPTPNLFPPLSFSHVCFSTYLPTLCLFVETHSIFASALAASWLCMYVCMNVPTYLIYLLYDFPFSSSVSVLVLKYVIETWGFNGLRA